VKRRDSGRRPFLAGGALAVVAAAGGYWWWRGRLTLADRLEQLAALVSYDGPLATNKMPAEARRLKDGLAAIFTPEAMLEVEGWQAEPVSAHAIVGDLLLLRSEFGSLSVVIESVGKDGKARARATVKKLDGTTETRRANLEATAAGRPLQLTRLVGRRLDAD
jgi:hypothetical protein